MKTLYLHLRKKPFDMILTGIKKEEYRQTTPYWISRLVKSLNVCEGKDHTYKEFDKIIFRNGYSKNARTMEVEFLGTTVGWPKKEYLDGDYKPSFTGDFVIKLGSILNTKNL